MYDSSMKYKWDNKAVLDYARLEGKLEGKLEQARAIARELKKEGLSAAFIAKTTQLSIEEIANL